MKPNRRPLLPPLVVGPVLLWSAFSAPPAEARQFGGPYKNPYNGNSFDNFTQASLSTRISQGMQRRMALRARLRARGHSEAALEDMSEEEMMRALGEAPKEGKAPAAKPAVKSAAAPPTPGTRFTPAPAGKRLLLGAYADGIGGTEEERKALREFFAAVFQGYEAQAKKQGAADDVAGAAAFFVATHYTLYTGAEVGDAATKGLLAQFRDLLGDEEMRRIPAEDKQKLYESLVLRSAFTLMIGQMADGQDDPKAKETARSLAGEGLRFLLRVDPERVRITKAGMDIAPESGK